MLILTRAKLQETDPVYSTKQHAKNSDKKFIKIQNLWFTKAYDQYLWYLTVF